jgi:ankyrin repeat protein
MQSPSNNRKLNDHPEIGCLSPKRYKLEKENSDSIINLDKIVSIELSIRDIYDFIDTLSMFGIYDKFISKCDTFEIIYCPEVEMKLQKRIEEAKTESDENTGNGYLHTAIEMKLNVEDDEYDSDSEYTKIHFEDKKKETEIRKKYMTFLLHECSLNINFKNNKGETPLGFALSQKIINKDIVEYLIGEGASLENVIEGKSVLHIKNVLKDRNWIDFFIPKLSSMNLRENDTNEGHMPLYYAYKFDLLDTFKFLLEKKDCIYWYLYHDNSFTMDIFDFIIYERNGKYYDIIFNYPKFNMQVFFFINKPIDLKYYHNVSYLDMCVYNDNRDFVEKLISKKIDLFDYRIQNLNNIEVRYNDRIHTKNLNAIHFCVILNRLEILKLILNYKPELVNNMTTKEGFTALYMAANYKRHDIAKYLLEKNADPNIKPKKLKYPPILTVSSIKNDIIMTELLFRYGANPNERDRNGITPFTYTFIMEGRKKLQDVYIKFCSEDQYKNITIHVPDYTNSFKNPIEIIYPEPKSPALVQKINESSNNGTKTQTIEQCSTSFEYTQLPSNLHKAVFLANHCEVSYSEISSFFNGDVSRDQIKRAVKAEKQGRVIGKQGRPHITNLLQIEKNPIVEK